MEQFLLQCGTGITKRRNFITMWGNQLLQCWVVQKENEKNEGGKPADFGNPFLAP